MAATFHQVLSNQSGRASYEWRRHARPATPAVFSMQYVLFGQFPPKRVVLLDSARADGENTCTWCNYVWLDALLFCRPSGGKTCHSVRLLGDTALTSHRSP